MATVADRKRAFIADRGATSALQFYCRAVVAPDECLQSIPSPVLVGAGEGELIFAEKEPENLPETPDPVAIL